MPPVIKGRSLALLAGMMLLLLAAPAMAQGEITGKVDEFIKAAMQEQKIPGVSVAVVKNGEVILAKGYGYANVEHQAAVKPETVFQSGSVGKQFTATAVMILVEEGKIELDEKIGKYLGEVPESWKNITVRHLLTHTGGLTDYPPDFDFRRDYTEDELLKRAEAIPLAFQPGEKWQYSNMGYVTLGILIGKVTGKFYGDFLQERIFKPLGMSARIINEADIIPNRAAGYRLVKGQTKNQEWVSPTLNTTADGSLYLTALDLAKWDAALYGEKLLKRSSLEQMWTPVKLNSGKTSPYGFGWFLNEVQGHRIIEHSGAWQGFVSYIARYVDDKLTVIILANLAQANSTKLAHGVAAIYNPELAPPPIKAIADKEPQVTAMAKELLQKTLTNTLDSKLLTESMRATVSPDKVRVAGDFLKAYGPLETIELVERSDEGELRVYRYRLIYKEGTLFFTLILTKEGKVASMQLRGE